MLLREYDNRDIDPLNLLSQKVIGGPFGERVRTAARLEWLEE